MKNGGLPIGRAEVVFSMAVYAILLLYGIYCVLGASREKENILSFDLRPGWLGRLRDASDFEWQFWTTFFFSQAKWFAGHALMSLTVCRVFPKARSVFYLTYSMVALSSFLSLRQVMMLVGQVCCVYLSGLTRRRAIVWVTSLVILTTLNLSWLQPLLKDLAKPDIHPKDQKYIAAVYITAIGTLRQISVAIDVCNMVKGQSKGHPTSLIEAFAYVFYYPTLASGPFISFGAFHKALSTTLPPLTLKKCWYYSSTFLRACLWWLVAEFVIHHMYFSALQEEDYYLISAPNFTVFAICILQMAFFHMKYVWLYAFSTAFVGLDGIETPPLPRCVLIRYNTIDIWKMFDVGLYHFVRDYIYIPLGGSQFGYSWQIVTSFVSFTFIGFWHGGEMYVICWALINFLTVSLERFIDKQAQSQPWKAIEMNVGSAMMFRVSVLMKVPVGLVSLWSIIMFVGGSRVAFNLYNKFLRYGSLNTYLWLITLSYFVMIAMIGWENRATVFPPKVPPKKFKDHKRSSASPFRHSAKQHTS